MSAAPGDLDQASIPPPAEELRRRRRRASPRRKVLFILLGFLAAWGGFELVWRLTATPAPIVDYHRAVHELVGSHQPDGENGWEALQELLIDHEEIKAEALAKSFAGVDPAANPYLDFGALLLDPFEPRRYPREMFVRQRMRERSVPEQIDALLAKPRIVRPRSGGGLLITVLLPELAQLRGMSKLLAEGMRVAQRDEDWEEVVAAYDRILGLASISAHQGYIIDRLVGEAIALLAMRELRLVLLESDPDEATCRALLQCMDRRLDWPPIEMHLRADQMMMHDVIQALYSDDGHGDGRIDLAKYQAMAGSLGFSLNLPGGRAGSNLSVMYLAGRRETTEELDRIVELVIEESRRPSAKRTSSKIALSNHLGSFSPRLMIVKSLLGSIYGIVEQGEASLLQERATRLTILLEIHRRRHGALPESLEHLSNLGDVFDADWLIDPVNDGPIMFRLIEHDVHGRAYVLYSMGRDGVVDHADDPLVEIDEAFRNSHRDMAGTDVLLTRHREVNEDIEP